MSDEYLWDRSGEPDPEVARLERLLARYRFREKRSWRVPLAIAASVLAMAYWLSRTPSTEWRAAGARVAEGQTIRTDSRTTTTLESEFVGHVKLDPDSELRVLRGRGDAQHLSLTRGTMHALIWAPPERFVVDTPSAKTIDLGCAYTLSVLGDGSGLLRVETGWVAFQSDSRESFIPAGAACGTRPKSGPGIPYFEDAPAELRAAVSRFDATGEGVDGILSDARPRDALTLWHLALRTSGSSRERVARRFAELTPGLDVAGMARGDHAALDAAWNALGLGATDWWRSWKRKW
jgi:hypothetical protein